ncbi:hypothetical protein C343_05444 [Cryptococcus neoformans C23]|uniref:BZIP domain-containing protein n=2 Tax=Cryptococcus neoformans TaxID=5207 RepID=A0A854QB74_CRYNE|nr:hypothetical protein CNAG_04908 [Cryptococcus neoformans var. grubii H99]AUB27308.1 hypothetical protein CKF44_04908 [Cryptococcus neoformans var. grubii]OWZ28595.1 hypothetical protein C347_05481 [Cryptococcus neoformans var. grubii AD2-60a]OWZ40634.1 hypothetical protein C343_05444 [Cryptococcus neoformans var. grubii C23]OWZ51584.1 hypothetical protein C368_05604 [Cryptococcus neoformans var. grubii 125.91]OXC82556.1 hypothetical protein C344_05167 [Cryptococcus neoformans var. grubii AD|eukprot:XP_012052293.1 hypothetical protein CNAG_04908 [Cryptococcus neoformans var. grubii H99]
MYHPPFPTPATPGHKDPFQFAPPNLHPPPAMHLSQQSSHPQPQPHAQQQSQPSHPPRHTSNSHSTTSSRHGSQAQSSHNHYSETDSEQDDDKVERDKLEIRREKNRVKQRNLRLRRANHIADLERDVANLKSDNTALQNALSVSQQHESNLQGWIHDLESVLFRNGLASDVEGLRRIWSDRELKRSRPSIGGLPMNPAYPPPIQQQAPIDPLSTLARAASQLPTPSSNMYPKTQLPPTQPVANPNGERPTLPRPTSFSRPYENPYPTPDVAWSTQMHDYVHSEAALQAQEGGDLKRRRVEEWQPYGIAGRPPTQATVTTMTGRRSDTVLPPIQPFAAPSAEPPRPPSAPNAKGQQRFQEGEKGEKVSPRLIRISDLVSPSHAGETFWGGSNERLPKRDENMPPRAIVPINSVESLQLPASQFDPGERTKAEAPSKCYTTGDGPLLTPLSETRA